MDLVNELFQTEDLYEILGVAKDFTDEKILRAAYMKAALKFHPDKATPEEREISTKKFQVIQKIYELFKDQELRKVYDDTGCWPEDDKVDIDLASFGKLDENAILEFKKMYQNSEEERQDIKKCYEAGQGDIFYICDNVFFLNAVDDEEKVNSIVEDLIEKGELTRLTKGVKSAKARERKLKKLQQEAKEADAIMKERNLGGGLEDLQKAILGNRKKQSSFLDDLEAKYGGTASKKNGNPAKKKAAEFPDDGPSSKRPKLTPSTSKSSRSSRSRSAR